MSAGRRWIEVCGGYSSCLICRFGARVVLPDRSFPGLGKYCYAAKRPFRWPPNTVAYWTLICNVKSRVLDDFYVINISADVRDMTARWKTGDK